MMIYLSISWSLTPRGEHRMRVFENRLLRKIFGHISDEISLNWRTFYNKELHNLCGCSHNIVSF
jgi:hypothetical protein